MIPRRPAVRPDPQRLRLTTALSPFALRFFWVACYFFVLLVVGTTGYSVLEGWSSFEALYMTAITATAVGYGEVHPLTESGRIFTMGLMAASIVGLGVLWALITAMFVELDLAGLLRRRRKMSRIGELSGHLIVCGAGRMGRVVIEEIRRSGRPFVVVEAEGRRVASMLQTDPGLLVIEADSTREQSLLSAGVERAVGLVACLPDDAANVFLCLTARGLNPQMEIVARAYDEESLAKLRRAGANHVISPAVTGAIRMAATLLRPTVVSFLDAAVLGTDIALRLEEATIPADSPLVGKSLADAKIPQRTGLIILALRCCGGDGTAMYNPGPDTTLSANDVMIVLGGPEQVQKLRSYAGGAPS